MALSDTTKFISLIVANVTLILTVIVGSLTVYSRNQANYNSLKDQIAEDRSEQTTAIRDNAEAIKDMVAAFTSVQEATDSRLLLIETSRWSITQEAESAARNAIANPGIRYSDPKAPGQYFFVEPR